MRWRSCSDHWRSSHSTNASPDGTSVRVTRVIPTVTHLVAARQGGVGEEWCEALYPPVDRDVIDLKAELEIAGARRERRSLIPSPSSPTATIRQCNRASQHEYLPKFTVGREACDQPLTNGSIRS